MARTPIEPWGCEWCGRVQAGALMLCAECGRPNAIGRPTVTEGQLEQVLEAIRSIRHSQVGLEVDTIHPPIAAALAEFGIRASREVRIGPGARVDFLTDAGIAIEAKRAKPQLGPLINQLRRYALSRHVGAIVVVAERTIALPSVIGGRQLRLVSLYRQWGVSA